MPRFEPFPAYRFRRSLPLDDVCAPPYDVLSPDEVRELRRHHPNNITHIDVPQPDDGVDPYAAAAATLQGWIDSGVLEADTTPSFTLYRMEFVDAAGRSRRTVGVLGALEVVDEGSDAVLAHERTTPKAKTDRLDLTRATEANLSPVWGLSLTEGLTSVLLEPGEAMGSMRDANGVVHSVERVSDPARVAAIAEAVAASPVLIADGHHRYAIARAYRDEIRAATGRTDTAAEVALAYVGELIEDQLSIDAIHRLYPSMTAHDLLATLESYFVVEDAGQVDLATVVAEMDRRGALCLLRRDGTGAWLVPGDELVESVRHLDGAFLEHALADGDVDIEYQHGVDLVAARLAAGDAEVAVLIRPTGIAEIRRTANERLLMPPKSTFFTPKLVTGLVIRSMAGEVAMPSAGG